MQSIQLDPQWSLHSGDLDTIRYEIRNTDCNDLALRFQIVVRFLVRHKMPTSKHVEKSLNNIDIPMTLLHP